MLDRRPKALSCYPAVLVLAVSLLLLPGFAAAGPLTPGSVSEDGFLSSWLGWLADGWQALTGSGETTLGGLWEASGVGIDPNGKDGGTSGGTTSTSPTSPTAQDGSTSTAQEK